MDHDCRRIVDAWMMRRRDFVKSLSAMGLGLAVTPLVGTRARAEAKLTYFTWSGYELPDFHKSYLAKHGGVEPDFGFFSDEEEALQKVLAGYTPDIVHPCVNTVGRWRAAGTLKPLDPGQISAWDKIFPQFLELDDVKADGQYWQVPFDWGTSSVIYRTDLVDVPEESWSIFLDDRYKGRMSFLDAPDNVAAIAGLLTGAENPMDMDDAQMKEAETILRRLHANMRFYWTDQSELEQAMAAGEVVAAWGWGSSVVNLTKQNVPIKMMNPKEGIMTWVCGLVSIASGPAPDADRYDFINAMLSPESGKYLIEQYAYGHANADSFQAASPEAVAALGFTDPSEFLKTGHFFTAVDPDKRQKIIDMWQVIRAGG
jgi:spermidine/putrescine-binding protein